MYHILQLKDKNLEELQDIAKSMNVEGIRSMDKNTLIYAIIDKQSELPVSGRDQKKERKPRISSDKQPAKENQPKESKTEKPAAQEAPVSKADEKPAETAQTEDKPQPKKRGRKPAVKPAVEPVAAAEAPEENKTEEKPVESASADNTQKRKRGRRPSKESIENESATTAVAPEQEESPAPQQQSNAQGGGQNHRQHQQNGYQQNGYQERGYYEDYHPTFPKDNNFVISARVLPRMTQYDFSFSYLRNVGGVQYIGFGGSFGIVNSGLYDFTYGGIHLNLKTLFTRHGYVQPFAAFEVGYQFTPDYSSMIIYSDGVSRRRDYYPIGGYATPMLGFDFLLGNSRTRISLAFGFQLYAYDDGLYSRDRGDFMTQLGFWF